MRELKKELWPYRISLNSELKNDILLPIELWLGEHLGKFQIRWNVVYNYNGTDFYFKNQEDATLFALRWA